jgi:hypothetical protein
MKALSRLAPALAAAAIAALFSAQAGAQLKPPKSSASSTAPAKAAATASPSAAAPAAKSAEVTEKEAAGQLAAAGWLVLLDRRDWGRAWETSSSVFRTNVPLGNWMDAIPNVRKQLGDFVERAPEESNYKSSLAGRPDGDYVTSIFATKFSQREVKEVVTTVREPDGKWRVTGYQTN